MIPTSDYSTVGSQAQIQPDLTHRTYRATIERETESYIATVNAHFPVELLAIPQWVTWALPWSEHEGRWTKRLRSPRERGFWASHSKPQHWADFETACGALRRQRNKATVWGVQNTAQGLGLVMTHDAGVVAIDLDHCIDADGVIAPDKLAIIKALNSYTEVSLSGDGVHIFVKTSLLLPKGVRTEGIEVYPTNRFLTVSGAHLDGTPTTVNDATEWLTSFYTDFAEPDPVVMQNVYSILEDDSATDDDEELADDRRLVRRARAAANSEKFTNLFDQGDFSAYPSQSEADFALLQILAFWDCDPQRVDRLFRRSALMRDKWDRRCTVDGHTYGHYSIARAIDLSIQTNN